MSSPKLFLREVGWWTNGGRWTDLSDLSGGGVASSSIPQVDPLPTSLGADSSDTQAFLTWNPLVASLIGATPGREWVDF